MKHIILGKGEVAGAVSSTLLRGKIIFYDKGEWDNLQNQKGGVLHITIPYNKDFVQIGNEAIKVFKPQFVIVHSTVKPDTTLQLMHNHKLYSPIRGRHENNGLSTSVQKFVKFFSGCLETFDYLKPLWNLQIEYTGENTSELEYMKIASTNYMYFCLVYEKTIFEECKKNGWDFDTVYTRSNETYNEGYLVTNPNFVRPVYSHNNDKFPGGHCLRPNIHLHSDRVSKFLDQYEKE